MPDLESLGRLAEVEFLEIVQSTAIIENKLRVTLIDGSYIDFWWSEELSGRFAYHWERIRIDGTVYRHDNIPHLRRRERRGYRYLARQPAVALMQRHPSLIRQFRRQPVELLPGYSGLDQNRV